MKSFHSISAGLITASIAISVNAAFSDLLGNALHAALRPLLFTLMMASCCLAMLLVAGNSRLKLAIPGLDEPAMVILSALVTASSLHLLSRPWSTGQVLSTLLCINALTALLTGAAFLLAARLRAGQLARCLPYPVLAAFMASSGLLLIVFGLSIAAGHSLSLTQPASWQLDGAQATQLGWGGLWRAAVAVHAQDGSPRHPDCTVAPGLPVRADVSHSRPAAIRHPVAQPGTALWPEVLAALPLPWPPR
jgi:MFS superfamily sulfate permease-like transporter